MAWTLLWTMALAATAMTADAALPDTTGYVNDGLNSNVSLQLYINFRNASNKAEMPIFLPSIPDDVKTRLSASGVSDFSKLDGRVQRAVLWDMGYAINDKYEPTKVYTLDGRKMSELTVSLDEFHDVGCVETNCTQPDGGISYSNLYCNGTQMQQAAKCAVEEFEEISEIHLAMWSTGGDPNAAPVIELRQHTWNDSGGSFKVYAIHTSIIKMEPAYNTCATSDYNSYVVPCQTMDKLQDPSANFSAPEQSEWIDTWLSEFQDSDPTTEGDSGFKLVYLIPIIAGVLVLAGFAFYCFVRRRRRRTNDEVDKDAVHDSVIDPSALLSPNNKDSHSSQFRIAVSEDSARPTLSTGTRTTMGSVTDPDEFGSNSILRTLFHDPNLADKRIPAEQIQLESALSKGAYGEVWLADIAGQKVAVKRLLQTKQPTFGEFQDFTNEIQLSASLDHPNIIQFVGVAWTSLNTLMLVLEFLPTGDLQTYLRKNADLLSWARDKIHMAVGLARALEYLHARVPPLIHRDLKSKNVLLTANLDPKLIDFGVSRSLQAEQMTAGVGTPYWTAPEVLEGTQYTEQSDIYSFGVLLTELDTCKIPYADAVNSAGAALKPFQILQDVVAGTLRPTLTPDAPPRIRRVADACLQRDPRKRPNASALIAMLEG